MLAVGQDAVTPPGALCADDMGGTSIAAVASRRAAPRSGQCKGLNILGSLGTQFDSRRLLLLICGFFFPARLPASEVPPCEPMVPDESRPLGGIA